MEVPQDETKVNIAPSVPLSSLPSPPPVVKKLASIFTKPTAKASPSSNVEMKPEPPSSSKAKEITAKASAAASSKKEKDKEDDDEDEEAEVEEEEEEEEEGPSGKRVKKASGSTKGAGSKVEGVGHGAVAAASKLAEVDVPSLVGGKWKEGEAVPFEFLADTFEEIAGTTKRLEIVFLLVR